MLESGRPMFIFHYPFDFFSLLPAVYTFTAVRLPTLGEGAQQHLPVISEGLCCKLLEHDVSPKKVYILKILGGMNHSWHLLLHLRCFLVPAVQPHRTRCALFIHVWVQVYWF